MLANNHRPRYTTKTKLGPISVLLLSGAMPFLDLSKHISQVKATNLLVYHYACMQRFGMCPYPPSASMLRNHCADIHICPPKCIFLCAPPHFVSNCHVLRPHVNFITSSHGICVQLPILLLLHLQMS